MEQGFQNNFQKEEQGIDIKELLYKILGFWPFVVGGALVGLVIAFTVNRYTKDEFELSTLLAVEENNNNPLGSADNIISFTWSNKDPLQGRIAILNSYTQNLKVAKQLGWEVAYWNTGRLVEAEVYNQAPYRVEFDKTVPQPLGLRFNLILNEEGYSLSTEAIGSLRLFDYQSEESLQFKGEANLDGEYAYYEWIDSELGSFRVIPTQEIKELIDNHYFYFQSYEQIAKQGIRSLNASAESKGSELLKLSMKGFNKAKIADFLNTTVTELRRFELDEKNLMATNTIAFIDSQLEAIKLDLANTEENLGDFRAENLIVDLGAESSQLMEQYLGLEQERSMLKLQRNFYKYVIDFLASEQSYSGLSLPALSGIEDLLVGALSTELLELSVELEQFKYTLSEENPAIAELEEQLRYTKQSLENATKNALDRTRIVQEDIDSRMSKAMVQITKLPATEQQLFKIQRQYEASGRQFELLLQKRAEAGILQASNLPDTKVIDSARDLGQLPIGPNRSRNLAIGLLIGLLIPIGYVVVRDLLNTKIMSKKDIEAITNIPMLGILGHSKQEDNLVVFSKPKSSVSEAFRALRSNLNFLLKPVETGGQVVLVTSSIGGEGKTFTAINLASVIALSGKKTCLVGLDLRKPKIFNDFGLSNDRGVSTLMSGQDDKISDIIQKSGKENLDIISAGPVPPNPSELLEQPMFEEMLNELRAQYDYIVLGHSSNGTSCRFSANCTSG